MKMSGIPQIMEFDPFNVSGSTNVQGHQLGELVNISDGRAYRYGYAGAAALAAGKLGVAPTPKTNHHNNTAIASALGTTTPTFTIGATAVVASEYNEGWVTTSVTPDVGRAYKIENLAAVASAGTANPTLFEGLVAAWTTSTRVNLVHNTWNAVIEGTSQTKRAAGVPLVAVAINNYYWAQTRGVASLLADGVIALGSRIVPSASIAGAVIAESGTYTTAVVTTLVGAATVMAGVDTEYRPMVLTID